MRIGRRKHRHREGEECRLGGGRDARRLGLGIVAHADDHTAVGTGPHQVPVTKRVRRAVESGGLAVPDREDAVLGVVRLAHRELAPGHGRRRQLLVQSGAVNDIKVRQKIAAPRQFQIEAGERRTRVAGDETAGVQPRFEIRSPLFHGQSNYRLHARHQHTVRRT